MSEREENIISGIDSNLNQRDIIVVENLDATVVYSGGLNDILYRLAEQLKADLPDISTEAGRKEIASRAYKAARCKTTLDDLGKKVGEDAKKKLDAINADRKRAREFMERLQADIRAPLTEWEEAEKERIRGLEDGVMYMKNLATFTDVAGEGEIVARIESLNRGYGSREWSEFKIRAEATFNESMATLTKMAEDVRRRDAERIELERLRAEAAERERIEAEKAKIEAERQRIEREERMRAEAAETARIEAGQKAAREAEQARLVAEKEIADRRAAEEAAIERAKRAEAEAIEADLRAKEAARLAIEKAERDRVAALEQAEREKDAAIQREREAVALKLKRELEQQAERARDKNHRAKINNEALAAVLDAAKSAESTDCGDIAKAIIVAIASGKVPHTKISY